MSIFRINYSPARIRTGTTGSKVPHAASYTTGLPVIIYILYDIYKFMIILTTSRKPSQRTRSFCRDLERTLPTLKYIQRGKSSLTDIINEYGKHRILVLDEIKGNPSRFRLYVDGLLKYQLLIRGVQLQREILGKKITINALGSYSDNEYLNLFFGDNVEGNEDYIKVCYDGQKVYFEYEGIRYPPYFKIRRILDSEGNLIFGDYLDR